MEMRKKLDIDEVLNRQMVLSSCLHWEGFWLRLTTQLSKQGLPLDTIRIRSIIINTHFYRIREEGGLGRPLPQFSRNYCTKSNF